MASTRLSASGQTPVRTIREEVPETVYQCAGSQQTYHKLLASSSRVRGRKCTSYQDAVALIPYASRKTEEAVSE